MQSNWKACRPINTWPSLVAFAGLALGLAACSDDDPGEANLSLKMTVTVESPNSFVAHVTLVNDGSGTAHSRDDCGRGDGVSFHIEDGVRTLLIYNVCIEAPAPLRAPCSLQPIDLEPGQRVQPTFAFTRTVFPELDFCRETTLEPGYYTAVARFEYQDESEVGTSNWQVVERRVSFQLN